IIEGVSRALMEGAAIIFPPAQAALIAMDFARFLVEDLPVIRTEIFEEPMRIVEHVQDFISPEMRDQMLERLWLYLLFEGDIPFLERIQARLSRPRDSSRRPATRRRSGTLGRLAQFAGRVGARILQAFIGLRNRARSAFIRAHRVVERHPLLHRFLRAIPGLVELASMVRGSDIEAAREFLGDLVDGDGPRNIALRMRETLDELFEGLNGLEVPAEILPMNLVLDLVIERFLMAMGARGRLINLVMGATNLRSIVADKLAEALTAQGLDPNILWERTVRAELQPLLEQARTDLIDGVNGLFNDLFGSLIPQVDNSNLPPLTVGTDSEPTDLSSEPQIEPMLDEESREEEDEKETEGLPPRPPKVSPVGGRPLPTPVRLRYERAFGHDFTHVRLHYDRHSDRIATYYRAQALTSGSHIFLGKELSPASPRTDRVLKHELAHVLQQTGSRPLNMDHRPEPQLGEPGRGLRLDPRREAAANRMSHAADLAREKDAPVSVEEPDETGGLLPSLSSAVIQRTIDYLGSERLAESFQHQIDTLVSIPASIATERRGEFTAAVEAARTIWNGTKAKLQSTTPLSNPMHHGPETFNNRTARGAISHYFTNNFDMTNPRLRALTFYSFRIRGNRLRLHEDTFKQNLANYISEATGFDIAIDPNGSTVDYVKVMYIDLGDVHGNTRVYQVMKQQTNSRIQRPGVPIPGVVAPFTDIEWAKIREQIAGGASDVPIWDDDEYRLGDSFIRKMREMLDAVGGGSVDTWENYTTTTDVSNATFGGLRVGTHGQLTGDPTRDTTLEPVSG
ncbi:MAG: DUF4157 domain-containing protein, partial [Chloroflexota bacterium]|nr:DUF4157 domain-containing protein [Chloroflexota bacterium]